MLITGLTKEILMLFEDNIPYDTLKILLIVIGTLGMTASVTKFKYEAKRILLIFFIYLCYVAASCTAIFILFDYTFFLRVCLIAVSAPGIYLCFKLEGEKPSKAVFNYATQILFSMYVCISITLIIPKIHGSELTDFLLRLAVYCAIILFEYRFLRRPFLRLSSIIQSGWLILAAIPCSLLVFSIALASYPVRYTENPTGVFFFYLLGVVIIILYFSIFQYLFTQYRFQTSRHNLELMKFQIEKLKEKMEHDAAVTERLRIDRHDTRHRFRTASYLLESGKVSEALEYITQSLNQLPTEASVTYCKDILLNATLSSYFEQAKKSKIALETYLSFPDTLPVDSGEFSVVIANALENAIKACCLFPEEQRVIICKCIYKPSLMLEISNPCKDDIVFSKDGIPLSKEQEHGIGTRSIMAFCKKYGALCSFSLADGQFTLRIVL